MFHSSKETAPCGHDYLGYRCVKCGRHRSVVEQVKLAAIDIFQPIVNFLVLAIFMIWATLPMWLATFFMALTVQIPNLWIKVSIAILCIILFELGDSWKHSVIDAPNRSGKVNDLASDE